MRFRFYLVSLCLVLSGCGSQIVNPVTGEAEYSVMTESAEIAEGRKAHCIVNEEGFQCPHPEEGVSPVHATLRVCRRLSCPVLKALVQPFRLPHQKLQIIR